MFCKILLLALLASSTIICAYLYLLQEECFYGNYSSDNSTEWSWEEYPPECTVYLLGSVFLFSFTLTFFIYINELCKNNK